jgi:hypothetical protein
MDALLSQKPFWKMFENPDSLLVLQEICMEILCNVVVEMGRERKLPKEDNKDKNKGGRFTGNGDGAVTVFDFAEILSRTEKRVNDDLLGGGPRTVDELRAIHTRNCTRYMRAMDKKENQARRSQGISTSVMDDRIAKLTEATKNMAQPVKAVTGNVIGQAGNVAKNAGTIAGIAGNVIGNAGPSNVIGQAGNAAKSAGSIAGNVIGKTGGVLNKFKEFASSPKPKARHGRSADEHEYEEVSFAQPKDPIDTSSLPAPTQVSGITQVSDIKKSEADASDTEDTKSALDEAQDLLDFLDDDVDSKTEQAKKEFADLLDEPSSKLDAADYFTIDDDDFL